MTDTYCRSSIGQGAAQGSHDGDRLEQVLGKFINVPSSDFFLAHCVDSATSLRRQCMQDRPYVWSPVLSFGEHPLLVGTCQETGASAVCEFRQACCRCCTGGLTCTSKVSRSAVAANLSAR